MPKTLRVLMVEPHEAPHELLITDQLDDLQETVGGLIEVIGNGDGTLLICNDEAKLNGMDGNGRLHGVSLPVRFLSWAQTVKTSVFSPTRKCRNICSVSERLRIFPRRKYRCIRD